MSPSKITKLISTFKDIRIEKFKPKFLPRPRIIGITRIRNEELIINDTLDHVGEFVDSIVILDDNSVDSTIKIAKLHPKVCLILKNSSWRENRIAEETRHRWILNFVSKIFFPKWIFYFDADERFEGINYEVLSSPPLSTVDAIRVRLYDAYLTPDDHDNIVKGQALWNRRKFFGPERRDIIMLWQNKKYITFKGLDRREPIGYKDELTAFYCQHYGKALSIDQWEQTCDYYTIYFPEGYKKKWSDRKGKSIHTESDFGRPLYTWDEVKNTDIKIHP